MVAGPADAASRRTPVEVIQGDGDDPSTAMLLLLLSLCSGLCSFHDRVVSRVHALAADVARESVGECLPVYGLFCALAEDGDRDDSGRAAEAIAVRITLPVDVAERMDPAVPTLCLGGTLSRLRLDVVGTRISAVFMGFVEFLDVFGINVVGVDVGTAVDPAAAAAVAAAAAATAAAAVAATCACNGEFSMGAAK